MFACLHQNGFPCLLLFPLSISISYGTKKLLFISGMTTRGETRERERERQQFLDDAKKAGDVCELASVDGASGERDIQ